MKRKLGMLDRRYARVDFDSRLALTYRPFPAAEFDGKEDGLRVLTRTSDRPIIQTW